MRNERNLTVMTNPIIPILVILFSAFSVLAQSQAPSSVLVDSFDRVGCGDVQSRTDAFVAELSNHPNAGGLIEVNPDAANPVPAFVMLQEITNQLRMRGFDEDRVNILINPARTEMSIQFWREMPGDSSRKEEPAGDRVEIGPPPGAKAIKFGSTVHHDGPSCGEYAYDLNIFLLTANQIPAVKPRVTIRAKNAASAKRIRSNIRKEFANRGVPERDVKFVNMKSMAEGVELWLELDVVAATEYRARISAAREVKESSADIDRYPNDPDAYMERAKAYKILEQFEEAIADLTRAIANSKHPYYVAQTTIDRGKLYLKQGDRTKAIADFTAVIAIKGADAYTPRAYLNRGEAHLANGDRDAALADSGEAIRLYTVSKISGKVKGLAEARKLRAKILSIKGSK